METAIQSNFESDIKNCLKVLESGGLILYPTDTVWGIGCDATNETAVKRVYELKKREETKAMIVLVADNRTLLQYVANPDPLIEDFLRTTVKPTTIIYEGAVGLASNLVGADGSIAIRITKELFCRHLIKRFRKPIVSTSANLSGEITPAIFNEIDETVKAGMDYIVQYRRQDTHRAEPSAVIKWITNGTPVVLRP
jgi:L-threonylcarbamoyladenylate synthase